MEHLILWVLCCIFFAISLRERNWVGSLWSGTILYIFLLFIHWANPDAPADFADYLDSAAQFVSDIWEGK